MRFTGKSVVVTGAGSGIGRACAVRFAAEGARVAVVDRDAKAAEATVELIESAGGEGLVIVGDVANAVELESTVSRALEGWPSIDVLINNAGVLRPGTVLDLSIDDWDLTFDVNIRGMFLMCRTVVPLMLGGDGGAIVNVASLAGLVGERGITAYSASKGAVVNFSRQLAADLIPHGVRVNCVCPGWVPTGFNEPVLRNKSEEEISAKVAAQVPMGRQGTPEEMAAVVTFLASSDASYVVGQVIGVDGGVSAII